MFVVGCLLLVIVIVGGCYCHCWWLLLSLSSRFGKMRHRGLDKLTKKKNKRKQKHDEDRKHASSVLSRLSDQHVPPPREVRVCVPAREHSCIGRDNAPYMAPVAAQRKTSQEHPDRAPCTSAATGAPLHAVRTAVGGRHREDYDQAAR